MAKLGFIQDWFGLGRTTEEGAQPTPIGATSAREAHPDPGTGWDDSGNINPRHHDEIYNRVQPDVPGIDDQEMAARQAAAEAAARAAVTPTMVGGVMNPEDPYGWLRNYVSRSENIGSSLITDAAGEYGRALTPVNQEGRILQARAAQMQLDAALGNAPSVAQLQLRSGLDEAQRAAMSTAMSAPAYDAALQRAAIESGYEGALTVNQQMAQLRAEEMAQAREALGSQALNLSNTDMSLAGFTEAQRQARYNALLQGTLAGQGWYESALAPLEFQAGYEQNLEMAARGYAAQAESQAQQNAREDAAAREAEQNRIWGLVGSGVATGASLFTGNPMVVAAAPGAGYAVGSGISDAFNKPYIEGGYNKAMNGEGWY